MEASKLNLKKRILAIVLSCTMVLSNTNIGIILASAVGDWSKTNPFEIEMEDGEFAKSDLYTLLSDEFGAPSTSTGLVKGFYYGTDESRATANTQLLSGAAGNLGLEDGTYVAWKATSRYQASISGYFKLVTYYSPTVTVTMPDGMTADTDQAIVKDSTKDTIGKVYAGTNNATIVVKEIENYDAVIEIDGTDITVPAATSGEHTVVTTLTKSSSIDVSYKAAETKSSVDFQQEGSGTITGTFADGNYAAGNLTFTATPNNNTYVKEILVDGVNVLTKDNFNSDRSYTYKLTVDGEASYTVKVVFDEKILSGNSTANVNYHPKKTIDEQLDTIKEEIFNKVIKNSYPETINWDDLAYEYLAENENKTLAKVDTVWSELNKVPANDKGTTGYGDYKYYAFANDGVNGSEKIRITWEGNNQYPSVSVEATITLIDSRPMQSIYLDGAYGLENNPISYYSVDKLMDYLNKNIKIDNGDGAITNIALKDGEELPDTKGESKKIVLSVDVSEGTEYQATKSEISVYVKLTSSPSTYEINKTGNGTILFNGVEDKNGTLSAGTYELIVTPEDAAGYVESIKVNGTEITNGVENFKDRVYTGSLEFDNEKEYTIEVVFATREINLVNNTTETPVEFNFFTKASEQLDTLKSNILKAVVESTNPNGISKDNIKLSVWNNTAKQYYSFDKTGTLAQIEIGLADESLNATSETVQIVWVGNDRYPDVTVSDIDIKLKDTRTRVESVVTYDGVYTYTSESTKADVIDLALTTANLPKNAVVNTELTVCEMPTISHLKAENAVVKFYVTEDANYFGSNDGDIVVTIPIIAEEVVSKLVAKDNNAEDSATGAVVFTNDENTEITQTLAGNVNITVTPEKNGSYVEKIVVTDKEGNETDLTLSYNKTVCTTSFTAESNNDYTVVITYGQRTISAVNGEIDYNFYYKASEKLLDIKNAIKPLVTASNNLDDTDTIDDFPVLVYWDGNLDSLGNVPIDLSGYFEIGSDESVHLVTTQGAIADKAFNSKSEKLQVIWPGTSKYPEMTAEFNVTVNESREQASIEHNGTKYLEDLDLANIDILKDLTISEDCGDVTIELIDGQELPTEGQSKMISYNVSIAENEKYLATTKEINVKVSNPVYNAKINVEQPEHATMQVYADAEHTMLVDTTKEVEPGRYYIMVTPESHYYVNATSGVSVENEAWNNCVYTSEFNVEYGETEVHQYDISAAVYEREIVVKENAKEANAEKNSKIFYTTNKDTLLRSVFEAIVDDSNPDLVEYSDVTVKVVDELKIDAVNEFKITWAATDMYPEVEVTGYVYISESRVEAEIYEEDIVIDESALVITEDDYNLLGNLSQKAKERILAAITNVKSNSGAKEPVLEDIDSIKWPEIEKQGQEEVVNITISVAENDSYLATTYELKLTLKGKVEQPTVTTDSDDNGQLELVSKTRSIGPGKYDVIMTPVDGYHASKLLLDSNIDGVSTEYNHTDILKGVSLEVKDGYGLKLGIVPNYKLEGQFAKNKISIDKKADLTYYVGMPSSIDLDELVLDAVHPEYNPEELAGENTEVYYLAREAGNYAYTITINLPIVGAQTYTLNIPADELWLNIGEEFPTNLVEPTQEDIQKVVEDVINKYSLTELMNMSENELKQLFKDELMANEEYLAYYKYFNAHQFGKNDTETVKLVHKSDKYGNVESNLSKLTLKDTRTETYIGLNPNVEMTYGFSEEELLRSLVTGVYTKDGTLIEGAKVKVVTPTKGMAVTDNAVIKLEYEGTALEYQDCVAEATIKINKAPVQVLVDNQVVKYGTKYNDVTSTNPKGVETIDFVVGLDVSDVNIDDMKIKGINGELQLMLPDSLQSILAGIGLRDGATMSVSELQDKLLKASDALGFINSENETIDKLITMIESLPTDTANMTVRIGGEMPTNIGVYLVGSVTSDANYETAVGVGLLAITPDGTKVDLGWKMEDENSIITKTLLTNGTFDMGAKVVDVADGNFEAAETQIVEMFVGVDINGNIILETDQTKLNVGAYTEVAMIVNWGNEMYYSDPIARAFVVAAEQLDVVFIDETGAENNERLFEFDNTEKSMDVRVSYKNGDMILDTATGYIAEGQSFDNLKIYYVGAQTNANPYLSTEKPVHAGAYTVTAVYTMFDNNEFSHMGMNVGALVIEPTTSDVKVDSVGYKYEEGTSHTVTDMVTPTSKVDGITPDTTIISAGITTDGNFSENAWDAVVGKVNVDLPTWLDDIIKKLGVLKDGYTEEGISIETFVSHIDKIEDALTEAEVPVDTISELKDVLNKLPEDVYLTFTDDVAYSSVGAYIVTGVVTDSDHYPSIDAGIMVIYPDVEEVELKFEEDWNDNNIFTGDYFEVFNTNASAYDKDGELNNQATEIVEHLFVGINSDGEVVLTKDKSELTIGAYTEFAYLTDLDSTMYVAKPIARTFLLVPSVAKIDFVDENGTVNHDRKYVYDNTQKDMGDIEVTDQNGNTIIPKNEELRMRYIGTDVFGNTYDSTEAPINAGIYTVFASYVSDIEKGMPTAGFTTGVMVIEKADLVVTPEDNSKVVNSEDPVLTYTTEGLATGDVINVTLEREAGEVVGTYVINVTDVTGSKLDNYNVLTETGTFTISIQENEWTKELTVQDSTYDGTVKSATAESKFGDTVIKYYSDEECTNEVTPINAGTYYVKATVEATEEYTGLESEVKSFVIAPKAVTLTVQNCGKLYGNEDPTFEFITEGLVGTDVLEVVFERTPGEDVGDYDILATVKHNPNYIVEVESGLLSITQVENEWIEELNMEGWTEGEESKTPTAKAKFGEVVFKYYSDEECTQEIVKPTEAGTYYVKAIVDETNNFTGLEDVMKFEIATNGNGDSGEGGKDPIDPIPDPDDPNKPDNPDDPDEPKDPVDPDNPTNPDDNKDDSKDPVDGDKDDDKNTGDKDDDESDKDDDAVIPNKDDDDSDEDKNHDVQTGDNSNIMFYTGLSAASLVGLILINRKRKEDE